MLSKWIGRKLCLKPERVSTLSHIARHIGSTSLCKAVAKQATRDNCENRESAVYGVGEGKNGAEANLDIMKKVQIRSRSVQGV